MRELVEEEQNGVKVYIPREYRFYDDTGEPCWDGIPGHFNGRDDRNAGYQIGEVGYDEELQKFSNTFECADLGGYDMCQLTYYFNSIADMLRWNGIASYIKEMEETNEIDYHSPERGVH